MLRFYRLGLLIAALVAIVQPLHAQEDHEGPTLPVVVAVSVGADLLDDLSAADGGPALDGRVVFGLRSWLDLGLGATVTGGSRVAILDARASSVGEGIGFDHVGYATVYVEPRLRAANPTTPWSGLLGARLSRVYPQHGDRGWALGVVAAVERELGSRLALEGAFLVDRFFMPRYEGATDEQSFSAWRQSLRIGLVVGLFR